MTWIGWLFDASEFLNRSHCGPGWSDTLRRVYIVSNVAIAISYFAIPILLGILYRSKRHDLPSAWMLATFAGFILLCGLTHASDVVVFYWAPYRLFTLLFALTGIMSLATACMLPRVVMTLVKLPSREYVHAINNRLQLEVAERTAVQMEIAAYNKALEGKISEAAARIARLEEEKKSSEWWRAQKEELLSIQGQFRAITQAGVNAGVGP